MPLRNQFTADLKTSMLAKDSTRTSTLRMIIAALKDKDIAARTADDKSEGLSDDAILSMLQGMIKQRRDSVEQYEKGGRQELADKEKAEIAIIAAYLPTQMSDEEISAAIDALITESGASGVKDMGKLMGILKEKYNGQMDFGKAGAIVKQKLAR